MSKRSMAVPLKNQTSITRTFLFSAIGLAIMVGFIAGTRSREILGAVAPLVGIHVETGKLDLSSVQKTYQALKGNYDGMLDDQALIDGASKGLTAACLLYTSDAADEEDSVDLGG